MLQFDPNIRADFIGVMRTVANTVTVVTTDGEAGKQGATVTAFNSVSADPPTVLVCLHSLSRAAKSIARNKQYCVNILPSGNEHVANRFAGIENTELPSRFEGIELDQSSNGLPMIKGASVLVCDLIEKVESGTHLILIGRVTEASQGTELPLLYHEGAYQKLCKAETEKTIKGGKKNGST